MTTTSHTFARRSLSDPGPLEEPQSRTEEQQRCPLASAAASGAAAAPSACPFSAAASAATTAPNTSSHPWQARLARPRLDGASARLSRRALRAQNRAWPLEEVARHAFADDAWIAVSGRVYDITEHVVSHKGWETGCGMTEVLSILAHLGTDCTAEFNEIHACYPVAFAQLRAYDIGALLVVVEEEGDLDRADQASGRRRRIEGA